jgi:hypothetical protein
MSNDKHSLEINTTEVTESKLVKRKEKTLIICAFVVLLIFAYALIAHFDFSKYQSASDVNLTHIGPRIKYVLQHSTLGVTWLLFCMFYVISRRVGTLAANPLAGHEITEAAKNIFNNSVEQFIMSIMSQLILVTHIEPNCILNVIPVINILFIIGRIMYWFGYPNYRGGGFALTVIPTIAVICFNTYKFVMIYI